MTDPSRRIVTPWFGWLQPPPGPGRLRSEPTRAYLDSYVGNVDFAGQEVVYFRRHPVWAMNYHGAILRDDQITAAEAGRMIQESLSLMYRENRFLGGFRHTSGDLTYVDTSEGDVTRFTGHEWIEREGVPVYALQYHGGLVREQA